MDITLIAPFLRGLALEASRGAPVVVASAVLEGPERTGRVFLDLDPTLDEAGLQGALRAALASAGDLRGLCLALRGAGKPGLLFGVGADLDAARLLVAGSTAAPSAAGPGRAEPVHPGYSARSRDRVVEGRVALVTGGAQGFGEEIVRGLASSGALVWIADMNRAGAERLASGLNAASGRTVALPLTIDVSSEASVRAAFAEIAATTGGLDLVVSNAGVLRAGSVLEQELADFEFVTRVNYTAFFLVAKHAALMLRRQRAGFPGSVTDIIQINSKSGLEGSNRNGAYAGSKFGSIGLVQSFALELVEHGIKVNAICPGNFFDGPLWSDPEKGLFVQYLRTGKVKGAKTIADVRSFYEAKVPMGRGCEGPDVMRAIYYLVDQVYETGQALPVTGGQVMLN